MEDTLWDKGITVKKGAEMPNHEICTCNSDGGEERIKDGVVEGRALTPSCKNNRITTSSWTIIDRKTLELTTKDTPHPKTKEKPQ